MDEAMRADRAATSARTPRRRDRAHDRRRRLPRQRQHGQRRTCASRRTRSATSRSRGCFAGIAPRSTRWRAFRGNYTQRDVMQELRAKLAQVSRPAHLASATCRRSTSAAAPSTSTSPSAGPSSTTLARVRRGAAHAHARDWAASSTPTPRSSSTSPSCASRSTATAPPTSACDAEDIAHGAAADGRRRRARSRASAIRAINEDYDVQLRLEERRPQRPGRRSRGSTCRAPDGGLVRLDSVVAPRAGGDAPSRIDRLDRQRMAAPRQRRARATRSATASRRCARPPPSSNMPPAYTTSVSRPRPRARAHVRRVHLGVPALDRVHVHDPRLAVREPARTRSRSCCRCRCRCRSRCCRSGSPATR